VVGLVPGGDAETQTRWKKPEQCGGGGSRQKPVSPAGSTKRREAARGYKAPGAKAMSLSHIPATEMAWV
jgi:hypothetical protein